MFTAECAGRRINAYDPIVADCVCPECKLPVIPKRGEQVIWHFAHRPDEGHDCSSEGETFDHIEGKVHIQRFMAECGYEVDIEVPATRRRIDVTASTRDKRWAIEVQQAAISPREMRSREADHRASGYRGTLWIFLGNRVDRYLRPRHLEQRLRRGEENWHGRAHYDIGKSILQEHRFELNRSGRLFVLDRGDAPGVDPIRYETQLDYRQDRYPFRLLRLSGSSTRSGNGTISGIADVASKSTRIIRRQHTTWKSRSKVWIVDVNGLDQGAPASFSGKPRIESILAPTLIEWTCQSCGGTFVSTPRDQCGPCALNTLFSGGYRPPLTEVRHR